VRKIKTTKVLVIEDLSGDEEEGDEFEERA
jgi:hypothetical protein